MSETSGKTAFVRHFDPDYQVALERDGLWECRKELTDKEKEEGVNPVLAWGDAQSEPINGWSWTEQHARRNWMPHAIGLLVISPRGDQLGMALPGTARRNNADYILTPPQLRMSQEMIKKVYPFDCSGAEKSVQLTALIAAREFLNMTNVRQYNDQEFFGAAGDAALRRDRLVYIGSTRGNDHKGNRVQKHGKHFHWVAIRLGRHKDVFRLNSLVYQRPQWVNVKRLGDMPGAMIMSQRKFEMLDQALLEYSRITGDYCKLTAAANQRLLSAAA